MTDGHFYSVMVSSLSILIAKVEDGLRLRRVKNLETLVKYFKGL